jgi:hypothetical protein
MGLYVNNSRREIIEIAVVYLKLHQNLCVSTEGNKRNISHCNSSPTWESNSETNNIF